MNLDVEFVKKISIMQQILKTTDEKQTKIHLLEILVIQQLNSKV